MVDCRSLLYLGMRQSASCACVGLRQDESGDFMRKKEEFAVAHAMGICSELQSWGGSEQWVVLLALSLRPIYCFCGMHCRLEWTVH